MSRAPIDDEPETAEIDIQRVLEAVADPIRLSIVVQLATEATPMSCGSITLPIKASTATHHFATLRQAGVIHQYYVGTSRMNVLRADDLEAALKGLLPAIVAGARRAAKSSELTD